MLIGPGTPCADLLLTNVKIRNSTIDSCCLATGQDTTKIFCEKILQERATAEHFPGGANCLLFDGMVDCEMRALVGLALGCDYLVGEIKGVGPKQIQELLLSNPDQLPKQFTASLAHNPKPTIQDPSVYWCIAKSILYEPTTDGYMREPPSTLYEYNKEFGCTNTVIRDNPCPMLECIGCTGDHHLFLSAEGSYECATCHACLGRFCVFEEAPAKTQCFTCATSF
jgi:hypothetical protein